MTDELRIEIDKLRLEDEWEGQSAQFYRWSIKAAHSQLQYDSAKSELELTEAELDRAVREDPVKYGVAKVTDTAVAMTVRTQPEYVVADKAARTAKYELAVVNAAISALEQRKRALTMLVELWIREYYSDRRTRPTTDGTEELDKAAIRSRGRRRAMSEEATLEDSERG